MGSRSGFNADGDFGEIQIPVDNGSGAIAVAQRQANALVNLGINAGTASSPGTGGGAAGTLLTKGAPLAGQVMVLDTSGNIVIPGTLTSGSASYVDVTAATQTLTVAQSGSTVLLDKSGGSTVTLPAPALGLKYRFVVKTVSTAGYKIITDAGTTFIAGGLYVDKSLTITRYASAGTADVSLNFNGTTTGGATIGDTFTLTCFSATVWTVEGTTTASGTLATPFATS